MCSGHVLEGIQRHNRGVLIADHKSSAPKRSKHGISEYETDFLTRYTIFLQKSYCMESRCYILISHICQRISEIRTYLKRFGRVSTTLKLIFFPVISSVGLFDLFGREYLYPRNVIYYCFYSNTLFLTFHMQLAQNRTNL